MLRLFLLSILLVHAKAELKCGEDVITQVIENYEEIVGNWTYIAHWDNLEDDKGDKYPEHHNECANIEISRAMEDDVSSKRDSCKSIDDSFDYDNAKYKLVAPDLMLKGSLLAVGSKKAIMETCGINAALEVRRLSEDYIMMINYEIGNMVELISKKKPSREELECFVDNIDVVKGLDGVMYCYN